MADTVGLYCKSYAPDFDYLNQLLESLHRHNPENIPFTLSLPNQDLAAFSHRFGTQIPNVLVVCDESYCGHDLAKFGGWKGQQVCKLMSCHMMNVDHYVVIDSDCYFISDIVADDIRPRNGKSFVACGSAIRTVLKRDNVNLLRYLNGDLILTSEHFPQKPEAIVDRVGEFSHYAKIDQANPDAIARSSIPFKAFGSKRWFFYQPGQIFSRRLLRQMELLLRSHDLEFGDAIMICPWEYNWYGEFSATHGFNDTDFRVSPILHFQDKDDLLFAQQSKISESLISNRFKLIQMAARHLEEIRYLCPP